MRIVYGSPCNVVRRRENRSKAFTLNSSSLSLQNVYFPCLSVCYFCQRHHFYYTCLSQANFYCTILYLFNLKLFFSLSLDPTPTYVCMFFAFGNETFPVHSKSMYELQSPTLLILVINFQLIKINNPFSFLLTLSVSLYLFAVTDIYNNGRISGIFLCYFWPCAHNLELSF